MALAVDGRDRIYVLWNANRKRLDPQRVYFTRSTDRGATWSAETNSYVGPGNVWYARSTN